MQPLNLTIAIVELIHLKSAEKGRFYRELIARNVYRQYKPKSETCPTYLKIDIRRAAKN